MRLTRVQILSLIRKMEPKIDHTSFEMFIIIIIEGRRRHDDADRCILQIQQSKRNGGLCWFVCGSFCVNCIITGAVDRSNFLGHA